MSEIKKVKKSKKVKDVAETAVEVVTETPVTDEVPKKEKKSKKEKKVTPESTEEAQESAETNETPLKPKRVRKTKAAKQEEKAAAAITKLESESAVLDGGAAPEKKKVKRIFTVLSVTLEDGSLGEFKGGKFGGSVPSSSARKSSNQICKEIYGDLDCQIQLTVKEITKGSSGKEYTYVATRKKNEKAVAFTGKDGLVSIPFKYSMTMKAVKKNVATGETELETVLDEPSVV